MNTSNRNSGTKTPTEEATSSSMTPPPLPVSLSTMTNTTTASTATAAAGGGQGGRLHLGSGGNPPNTNTTSSFTENNDGNHNGDNNGNTTDKNKHTPSSPTAAMSNLCVSMSSSSPSSSAPVPLSTVMAGVAVENDETLPDVIATAAMTTTAPPPPPTEVTTTAAAAAATVTASTFQSTMSAILAGVTSAAASSSLSLFGLSNMKRTRTEIASAIPRVHGSHGKLPKVTFHVGPSMVELEAHRNVLSLRVPALYELILTTTATKDDEDSNIVLPTMDPTLFVILLDYIYTNKFPSQKIQGESLANSIFTVANQFGSNLLIPYNAARWLLFVDLHLCALLKEACVVKEASKEELEEKTGHSKTYFFIGAVSLIGLLVYVTGGLKLVSDLVGFLYPAYMSFKALEGGRTIDGDATQWMVYWIMFCSINLLESTLPFLPRTVSFYYLVKIGIIVFLYHPKASGAQVLYRSVVRPYLQPLLEVTKSDPTKNVPIMIDSGSFYNLVPLAYHLNNERSTTNGVRIRSVSNDIIVAQATGELPLNLPKEALTAHKMETDMALLSIREAVNHGCVAVFGYGENNDAIICDENDIEIIVTGPPLVTGKAESGRLWYVSDHAKPARLVGLPSVDSLPGQQQPSPPKSSSSSMLDILPQGVCFNIYKMLSNENKIMIFVVVVVIVLVARTGAGANAAGAVKACQNLDTIF